MKRVVAVLLFCSILFLWVRALPQAQPQAITGAGNNPVFTYLGEGGSYSIPPSDSFLIKRLAPFRFEWELGSTYSAAPDERVWQVTTTESVAIANNTEIEVGEVSSGCTISFIILDDDIDERINTFKLDGTVIYTIPQGMVSSGQFTTDTAGQLTYHSVDSTGYIIDICDTPEATATATATETAVATETPTATATQTVMPTETATATATPENFTTVTATPTTEGTITATATPNTHATATSTPLPTATVKLIPLPNATMTISPPTPTPTKMPRLNACLRINFEISGDYAHPGNFVVQEVGGRLLASWHADEGWQDSGWIRDIDITHPSVFVEVYFVSDFGSDAIKMHILNPAPGTEYGWLSRGVCHALEVGWPENMPELPTPDPNSTPNPIFEDGGNNNWTPVPPPTATPTPKSSSSLLS